MIESTAEQSLIDAAIAGDAAAVEQLLLIYYSRLQQYVGPKISPHARRHFGAEDILQLVFAQAFRDIARFESRGEGSFFAWLKTIADHRIIDSLRAIGRGQLGIQLSWANFGDASSIQPLIDIVGHDSGSPSKAAAEHEAIQAIQVAIASLPEDQEQVIRLRYLQGKSVEEIAAETGRTEGAVRGLIHRGKQNLCQAMERSSRWFSSR
jgi:RNA polymerase sigma-70 factor (ECF subfamily)